MEAKTGPWQYHSEVLTDQTPQEVCANIVREKLLENLRQEVPYTMTQVMAAAQAVFDDMLMKAYFYRNVLKGEIVFVTLSVPKSNQLFIQCSPLTGL